MKPDPRKSAIYNPKQYRRDRSTPAEGGSRLGQLFFWVVVALAAFAYLGGYVNR